MRTDDFVGSALRLCMGVCAVLLGGCEDESLSSPYGPPPAQQDATARDTSTSASDASPADTEPENPYVFIDLGPLRRAQAVHVDDTHIYWMQVRQRIMRAPKRVGAEAEQIGTWEGARIFQLFVTDDTHVYWLNGDHVAKFDKASGETTALPLGADYSWGVMTSDGAHLFFAQAGCLSVGRIAKDGSDRTILRVPQGIDEGGGTNIVVDDTTIYCAAARWIYALPEELTGEPRTLLQTTDRYISGLAHDATQLYWADRGWNLGGPQSVRVLPKLGGTPQILLAEGLPGEPAVLDFDEGRRALFWISSLSAGSEVVSLSLRDRTYATLTDRPPNSSTGGLAWDDQYLYWTEEGAISRISKDASPVEVVQLDESGNPTTP